MPFFVSKYYFAHIYKHRGELHRRVVDLGSDFGSEYQGLGLGLNSLGLRIQPIATCLAVLRFDYEILVTFKVNEKGSLKS